MKKTLLLFLLFVVVNSYGAARFWVGGGSSTNWSATSPTNWSATSGGSNNATVPGTSDDVTFNGVGASANGASVVASLSTILSLTFTSGYTNTVTVNGQISIAGNFTDNTAHGWAGASGLLITAAATITSGGKTFPNAVSFSGNNTKTLVGDWTIGGTLTSTTSTTTINKTTAEVISCAGLTVTGAIAGTINITLTGGTWSGNGNNTISGIISFAGNSTFSYTGAYGGGTIKYTSGTITTTGSTLTINSSSTLDASGVSWNNITLTATQTLTINSLLLMTGTLSISNAVAPTFAGTAGWTCASLSVPGANSSVLTLKNGITYTITTALTSFMTRIGSNTLFTSDDGAIKAILTLQSGSTCNVIASFTRIDAGAGRTIWTFNGTVTNSTNINSFTDLKTVSKSFVQ